MARNRDDESTVLDAPEIPAQEASDSVANDTVAAPVTEAPAASETAPVTEQSTTAEGSEPKPDLEAIFAEKLATALETADTATNTVPDGALNDLASAYRALRGRSRERALFGIGERMSEALSSSDFTTAQTLGSISKALQSLATASAPKAERTPVDPTEEIALRAAALSLAADFVQANLPEGVDGTNVANKIGEVRASYDAAKLVGIADMPSDTDDQKEAIKTKINELNDLESAVFKLVSGKGTGAKVRKTRSTSSGERVYNGGPRRDIPALMLSVCQSKPNEWLSSGDIVKALADAGDPGVSSGAISNVIEREGVSKRNNTQTMPGCEFRQDPKSVRFVG